MSKKILGLLMGFVLGAFVGYLVVMIFVPVTGKDFRQRLRGHVDEAKQAARLAADKRREELESELAGLRKPS